MESRKELAIGLCGLLCSLACQAQQQTVWQPDDIRSLQLLVDDNPLSFPVLPLRGHHMLTIVFDEMSHDYHRFRYHVEHCDAQWQPTEGLFESDYLAGFNDQPIEDYENSFNTTQLYTHYTLTFPNENTRLLLSGNYRVTVYDEDTPDEPAFCCEFCINEQGMGVTAEVTANTDVDFNQKHQQLSFALSYGALRVIDPTREVHTVVMQNRRTDNRVVDLPPNVRKANGLEWTHRRELIFPAGNEYRKFELLDMRKPGLNIDRVRWDGESYHTFVYPDPMIRHYTTDEDQNGAFVLRNTEGSDATEGEYSWVHFYLQADEPLPTDVFLTGLWANPFPDTRLLMEWSEAEHCYEGAAYLKQGYYNYTYRTSDGRNVLGDFYETENEYTILVYYRAQGARYDRLVATAVVH